MAENGYMTRITQAILVDLQDEIGGLDKLLSVMGDSNVNLHYIYTVFPQRFESSGSDHAL